MTLDIVVSADSHVSEPADLWTTRIAALASEYPHSDSSVTYGSRRRIRTKPGETTLKAPTISSPCS